MKGWRDFLRVPVIVLLLANLWPLYGVWFLGWGVFELIVIYWLENVVIGLFNILKMATPNGKAHGAAAVGRFFFIPFFVFHYGMFTAIHGMFVIMLFGPKGDEHMKSGGPIDVLTNSGILSIQGMSVALMLLVVSHMAGYYYDYIRSGEYRRTSIQTLMNEPYGRVVLLHVTIIFGGFLVMSLNEPLWALVLMIAIKLIGDMISSKKGRTHGQGSSDPDADVRAEGVQSR